MNTYLEIKEQLTDEEFSTKQPQEVRIKVNDKNHALAILPIYEPAFTGLAYVKRLHYCNHNANLGCTEEIL